MTRDTEAFLSFLNRQNESIAARQAGETESSTTDPIREQREQERRERWGTLRAREKQENRPRSSG